MTKSACAALVSVVLALVSACADEPGTPVADQDLPSRLTLGLEHAAHDAPSLRVIRTLSAELVSPVDIPVHGLKFPRLEPSDGSPWPTGWRVLPGELPFGAATDGIPAGRRFTWPVEILRMTPDSPTSAEMVLSLEYATTPGGAPVRTTSAPVRVEFATDAVPHGLGEQDVLGASGGDIFLRVMEAWPGRATSIIEVRPGGVYRARSGGAGSDATPEASGVLSDDQQARLRDALEESRIWEALRPTDAADPRADESYISVVLVIGDASSFLRVTRSMLEGSAAWPTVANALAELTGVAIAAK